MIYSNFKIVPLRASRPFIKMIPKWKEAFIKIDSLLTMITNSFKNLVIQKLGNIFIFLFFVCTIIHSLFRNIKKIQNDKNVQSTNPLISCKYWHQNKVYIVQEMHLKMKIFINKSKKTTPSWSFISTLLMTIDKFFEFDRICINPGLNLIFEGCAKLLVEETISLLHVDVF